MLKNPLLDKFRQGDFIQYMNNVLDIVTSARATTLNLESQRDSLYASMTTLNNAWQPAIGSEITPKIAEMDKKRDKVFSGLKSMVDNWAIHHFDTNKLDAAFAISDNIKAHARDNRITHMRYQQQTATVNAILNDLTNDLSTQVQTLGITDWVTELSRLNKSFNDLYIQRAQAISGHDVGSIAKLIESTTEAFRNLKNLFDARFAIAVADATSNQSEFEQVEREWNTITQQYTDAVKRFSTPNENKESNPTDTEK